ncbi:MAG: ABC transporter substrate-binding protein [Rhizobiaceae bacterium]|nr:ABC transporter substrate-binding protein [Rhizobiaceae bacterium]
MKACVVMLAAALAIPAASCAGASAAEPDAAILAFVDRINQTTGAASPGDKAAVREACRSLVTDAFDFETMAGTASYDSWKRMTPAQKTAYREALVGKATDDCASRGKEVAGKTVEIVGVRDGKGGERQVAVQRSDRSGRVAIWKVIPAGSGVRAIDVVVDGHSLVANARNQARQILENSGGDVNALIRAIGG